MQAPLIRLENISYEYKKSGFRLECGFLELYAGENVLITGPVGSGKTTLSKLMCGILKPHTGSVLINGTDSRTLSLGRIGQTAGYLFQDPQKQLFTATVWEEILFADSVKGTDLFAAAERADGLLKKFGLYGLKDRSVYRLSIGEKQRLALCAVLMQGARYLIMDEPGTGLDCENRSLLYETIKELNEAGIGTAVVTHSREMIERFGARQIRVLSGKVTA